MAVPTLAATMIAPLAPLARRARRAAPPEACDGAPGVVDILRASASNAREWARFHPRWTAFCLVLLTGNVAYSCYRAVYLSACDLRVGYLLPARGLLFEHKDLFTDYAFNSFPPFFYCVLAPFALLPNAIASLLWSLTQLACFFIATSLFAHLTQRLWGLRAPRVVAPVLMAVPLFFNNLHLGQSNLLPLTLVVAGAFFAASARDVPAGTFLATAAAFKVTPLLALGYLSVLKRRWRVLVSAMAVAAVCLLVVPSTVFGPRRATRWLGDFASFVAEPFVRGRDVRTTNLSWYHTNQSMEAFLQRHFTRYGSEQYGAVHAALDPAFLDERAAHRAASIVRCVLLAALVALALRSRGLSHPRFVLEAALVPMAALFLSPVAWTSHYVAALPAYMAAVNARALTPRSSAWHRALTAGLGAAVGLLALAVTPATESFSPVFLGHFVLFCVLLAYALFGPLPEARE